MCEALFEVSEHVVVFQIFIYEHFRAKALFLQLLLPLSLSHSALSSECNEESSSRI